MKIVLTTIFMIFLTGMLSLTAFSFGVMFVVGGPPSSGDWIVTGTESYGDQTIVLDGNLIVENGGNLTFRKVTLKMNCTYDAQCRIEVRAGGKFYVLDGSVITAVDLEKEFLFDVHAESIFRMNSSELHECGIEDGGSGLSISSEDAVIENSLLSNNWYAIMCSNCNPVIRNNNISSNKFEAVLLYYANGTIEGNHIENNGAGIRGDNYCSPIVRGNTLVKNAWPIHFYNYCSPTIENNTLIANDNGIILHSSERSILYGNSIEGNSSSYSGIAVVSFSHNNTVTNNTVSNCAGAGIYVDEGSSHNVIANNTFSHHSCGVRITNSSFGNVITGNTIVGNREGMQLLFYAPDNLIVGNTISSNWYRGVSIGGCPGNRIIGNIVTNNTEIAIDIADSEHVEILDNTISNNPSTAIFFGGSSRANVVEGNTIVGNINSIGFWSNSSSNIIYHNNFVNNEHQAPGTLPPGMEALNVWDNGAEGNYWSDYTGVDSNHDGIGDAMHVMDANNTDRYPLMGMFSDFNATLEHHVQIVCNSSLSNFVFNGTVITFDVAGKDNTTGFCRICIPTGLINETYRIFVNRTEVQYSTLSCSNTTHKYLYFSYTHPEKVLIINDDWYKANALVCDVNRDMKVDVKDLVTAIASFGSHSGDPKWNPHSDVTGDGTVNIIDFATIIKHFGEHYP